MHADDEAAGAQAGHGASEDEEPEGGGGCGEDGADFEEEDGEEEGVLCGKEGVELTEGERAGRLCHCAGRRIGVRIRRKGCDARKNPFTTHGSCVRDWKAEEMTGRAVAA